MITRKNAEQLALMRRAGAVVAEMHEACIRAAVPGASTLAVDAVAREVIAKRGARSNFLGYHGFPAVVCTSPNDVIVHGIPSADVVLQEGDILSIDCGAIIEGWHADAAVTVPIGEVDEESTRLMDVTRASLDDLAGHTVDVHRRSAWLGRHAALLVHLGHDLAGPAHQRDLVAVLPGDHAKVIRASIAPRSEVNTASLSPCPSTLTSRPSRR